MIAAFIIGKYNHAQELRIRFEIDPESQLTDVPDELSREKLVTILGNLLDNAFDAAQHGDQEATVKLAMTDLAGLPPIEVYQIDQAYFVIDGNHRVSVARQLGATHIQAYVTEVQTAVPLSPDVQPDDRFLSSEDAHPSPSREGNRTEFCQNLDVRLHLKVERCQ